MLREVHFSAHHLDLDRVKSAGPGANFQTVLAQ